MKHFGLLLLAAGVLCAGRARAAGLNVSPVKIELDRDASKALLTLRNDGSETTRYQVSVSAWDEDPTQFAAEHAGSETEIRDRIVEGIATFPEVSIPRSILGLIAEISIALEVDGHRADLVCSRAAQAEAAFEKAATVGTEHVTRVADMVYAHRVRSLPFGKGGPNIGEVINRVLSRN